MNTNTPAGPARVAEVKRAARVNDGGFEVMKTRLSSTIWLLVIWTTVALFAVLGLAYDAGARSGGVSIFQGGATGAGPELLVASAVAAFTALALLLTLPRRVLSPIGALSAFSERFAAGDQRARAEVPVDDEFGVIAE